MKDWRWISDNRFHIAFFVLMAIVLLIHNDSVSLWDQDEAAYAGFADNMLSTGDWLIPDYPWSKIHRKPPLHFWNIAISAQVFGMNEFSTRFPSALFIFLTLILIYKGTRDFLSKKEAFLSAVVLGTSLFVSSLAKISVTDGTLLFFMTMGAIQLVSYLHNPRWQRVFVFWLAFAGALLVKGPPVIIFTGFFAALLFVFHSKRMSLLRFHPWFFLPIAALPLGYWGYLAWQQDGGTFIRWMLDWYILKRIGGSVLGQSAPFGSHFLFILLSFSPYVFAIGSLFTQSVKSVRSKDISWIVLILWFVAAWFPYELTPSKLPAYTVAAHIPFAILLSKTLLSVDWKSPNKAWLYAQCIVSSLFIIGVPIAGMTLGLGTAFLVTAMLLSLSFLTLLFLGVRGLWKGLDFRNMIFYNMFFIAGMWVIVYPQIDIIKNSTKRVAELLLESTDSTKVIVANSKGHPPSLIFYLNQIFDEVVLEEDIDMLYTFANETSTPLVLSQQQYEVIKSKGLDKEASRVCSIFTDRKGQMCYYILHP